MGPFYSQKMANELTLKIVKELNSVEYETLLIFIGNLVKRKQFNKVIVVGLPIDKIYQLCQAYDGWKGSLTDMDVLWKV